MAIKTIEELTSMTTSELTSADTLLVSTPGDTSDPVKKISAEAAFSGGGGGSSLPDIYIHSTCDDNPGAGGETYTAPVISFGDAIDNIVTKIGNGSVQICGTCTCPGPIGDLVYPICCEAINVVPKAALEQMDIATLSDALVVQPYILVAGTGGSMYTYKGTNWDGGFIFYTDGAEDSPTYGEIIPLVIGG